MLDFLDTIKISTTAVYIDIAGSSFVLVNYDFFSLVILGIFFTKVVLKNKLLKINL